MKKVILILLTLYALLFTLHSLSQTSCLPEGIEFESQADIDNFQNNYPGCTEIEGNVTIGKQWYSSNITNLNGLSVLTSVGGLIDVRLNDNLMSLSGLSNINSVGGIISVFDNDALTDLTGLDQITQVNEHLYITYNDALVSLTGLENLNTVIGEFTIRENTVLPDLSGLENLGSIGGALEIRVNESLANINGLSSLNSVGDYVWIVGNDILGNLMGLESLTSLPSYLEISFNPVLSDLTGLDNLISIDGYLDINSNENLSSLSGLDNLSHIGGNLRIRNNPSLASLTSLENLTTIGGEFRVSGNPMLTSLSGLDNIEANTISDLWLHDNTSLSTCDIESVCGYLAAPSGAVYIQNNATGCAYQEEVEEACFTGIEKLNHQSYFTITPNPCSDHIIIRITNVEQGMMILDLFEISGIRIKQLINEVKRPGIYDMEVDLRDLNPGVYFCTLKANPPPDSYRDGGQTKKIIKL